MLSQLRLEPKTKADGHKISYSYVWPRLGTDSASGNSLLLRLHTDSFMVRGPDISFLSTFPEEKEFLFPSLTFLQPISETQTLHIGGTTFTVLDVAPQQ